jgi:hypothetical protein
VTVAVAEPPIDVTGLWRRVRYPVVLVVIGLAIVTALAAIGAEGHNAVLDPRNTAPEGAHALATLTAQRGIPVTIAATVGEIDDSATTTVVVSAPGELSESALHAVAATAATVVLVDPAEPALRAFGVPATPDAVTSAATVDPGCAVTAAVTAGSVRMSGDLYAVSGDAARCYVAAGDAGLVVSRRPNHATTYVVGSPSTLSNAELGTSGNAALALGLLDNDAVQWVPGGLGGAPPPADRRGLVNLLPARLLWATLQVGITLLVLALWRARRLGKPVVEPLPVVVRAAETVEGRGRLMRAARSRGLAAESLRAASIRRLARRLGLGLDPDRAAIVGVVAERTSTPVPTVDSVLYGDVPPDDPALVRLAQQLDRLEAAVRRDDPTTTRGGQP